MKYDVFISYSSKDQKVAEGICGFLESNGTRCFVAFRDIPPGKVWASEIVKGLDASAMMVIVYSQSFNKSEQVDREIELAAEGHKPMLTYRLTNDQFEGAKKYYLKNINWIDAFPEPEKYFGRLLDNIKQLLPKDGETTPVVKRKIPSIAPSVLSEEASLTKENVSPYSEDIEEARKAMSQFKMEDAFDLLLTPSLDGDKDAQMLMASLIDNFENLYNVPEYMFGEVKDAADRGYSFAQYIMSRYYVVKEVNPDEEFRYAQMSANQGDANGLYVLNRCYDFGTCVERNETKSKDLLRRAMRKGSSSALLFQARNYLYALTVKRNVEKGIELLQKCMDKRIPESFKIMGDLYCEGNKYIKSDLKKAEELYRKAIDEGCPQAYYDLGCLYIYEPKTYEYLSEEACQKGMKIIRKGAEFDIPACLNLLASFYYDGKVKKEDKKKALQWYLRAADKGDKFSMYMVGFIYYYGDGEPVDFDGKIAWEWFKKGSLYHDPSSLYMQGIMCLDGYGLEGKQEKDCIKYFEESAFSGGFGAISARKLYEIYRTMDMEKSPLFKQLKNRECLNYDWASKDDEKALKYLKRAAELDLNDEDILRYGLLLTETDSPYSNEIEGVKYLQEASDKGMAIADIRLGDLYKDGDFVEKNVEKSTSLYKQASDAGNALGKARYGNAIVDEMLWPDDPNKYDFSGNEWIAFELLTSAYKEGEMSSVEGILTLGINPGILAEEDFEEAQKILEDAANKQHLLSILECASMYNLGYWNNQNREKAIELYKLAAQYQSEKAAGELVKCLYTKSTDEAAMEANACALYWIEMWGHPQMSVAGLTK